VRVRPFGSQVVLGALGALAAAAVLGLAPITAAHAQPHAEIGLVWQAPSVCPDAGEVRARIERRLGSSLDRALGGIEVEIALDGNGGERRYVARIDLRAVTVANEIRVLTSARCDELTDAVAVVIARVAAERRAAQPAARVERAIAAPASLQDAPRPWGGGLRVLGISGVGATPGIGLGGELSGYVRRHSLFGELAAATWLPSSKVLFAGAPGRVDVALDMVIVRLGWGPQDVPLRAWLSGELGSIDGRGVAFERGEGGSARWVGAGAGFAVAWPMTRHARLIGVIEAVVPLQRARFVLEHGTEIYRPDLATARCGLGLEVGWR
jgi:hypothetical protein